MRRALAHRRERLRHAGVHAQGLRPARRQHMLLRVRTGGDDAQVTGRAGRARRRLREDAPVAGTDGASDAHATPAQARLPGVQGVEEQIERHRAAAQGTRDGGESVVQAAVAVGDETVEGNVRVQAPSLEPSQSGDFLRA